MSENEVKVQKPGSKSNQFGKGPTYHSGKTGSKFGLVTASGAVIAATVVFVVSDWKPEPKNEPSEFRYTIEEQQNPTSDNDTLVSVPNAVYADEIKSSAPPRKPKPVVKLGGLEQIRRSANMAVPPGSLLQVRLETGASEGAVRAKALESLEIDGEELVPEGAILLGQGRSGDNRLFIRFTQLVFPDGQFTNISADAADLSDKIVGLKGSKVSSYAWRLAGASALNFVSGYSEGLKERSAEGGVEIEEPTARNAALNGASQAALELSKQEFQKLKNQKTVIEVKSGKKFLVIFSAN